MKPSYRIDHDFAEQELFLARHGLPDWETHLLAFCTNVKITDDDTGETLGYIWFHDIIETGGPACMIHACIINKRAWSRRLVHYIFDLALDEGYQMAVGEVHTPDTRKIWKALGAEVHDALAFLDIKKDLRI